MRGGIYLINGDQGMTLLGKDSLLVPLLVLLLVGSEDAWPAQQEVVLWVRLLGSPLWQPSTTLLDFIATGRGGDS